MFQFTNPLNYTPAQEDSITAIAAREGRTPEEVAYDMLIADDGKGFIFTALVNYANYDLEAVKTMYARQHVIPGLRRRRRPRRVHLRRLVPDLPVQLLGPRSRGRPAAVARPGASADP